MLGESGIFRNILRTTTPPYGIHTSFVLLLNPTKSERTSGAHPLHDITKLLTECVENVNWTEAPETTHPYSH